MRSRLVLGGLTAACIVVSAIEATALADGGKNTPEFRKQAKKACKKALTIPEANKILDPKPFIEECLADTLLTGGFDFVEAVKNRYLMAVKKQSTK